MLLRLRSGHQTRDSAKSRRRETCLKLCWIILNFSVLALTARNVPRWAAITFFCSSVVVFYFLRVVVFVRRVSWHFPHPAFHSDLLIGSRNHNYITLVQVCTNRSKGNVATCFSRRLNVTFEHCKKSTRESQLAWFLR